MRPTVLSNANASAAAGVGGGGGNNNTNANGITIPIHHEYGGNSGGNVGGSHPQTSAYYAGSPSTAAYGSPRQQPQQAPQQQQAYHPQGPQGSAQQQQQQQQPHAHPHQHFQQGFGFEPDMDMDMDMDMFPRSRLGRMHDPFGTFNNSHFGFPQFNSLGRRRAADHMGRDDDFFNRLPSEFRQYIPEGFGHRRAGESATLPRQHTVPAAAAAAAGAAQQQQQQVPVQGGSPGYYHQSYVPASSANGVPQQTPSKKLCDAAIQTEDPTVRAAGGDQVDNASAQTHHGGDNLKQHGLRNTMDMGVKSALESEQHGARAHSAPPQEQQQQQQQGPVNGKRQTPPPQAGHSQFGTQTSPHVQGGGANPQFQKAYYPPQQQPHPQQQRHESTPPQPQTPGGTYIRTIPIFVEGRSEPIINAHKEIPNQNSAPPSQARAQQQQQQKQQQQQQQQHRPTPINTQQQQQQAPQGAAAAAGGVPPQTPHTLDSISKIQDIQRDVLDLMGHVEKFTGTRQDKQYAYLDEMLTRNLLKLDTIDTNGKDSIRLARKEAIKCIQASINVLEAKANENTKAAQQAAEGGAAAVGATDATAASQAESKAAARKSASKEKVEAAATDAADQPADAKQMQAPIPLPPPEGMQTNEAAAGAAASTTEAATGADGNDANSAQASESSASGGGGAEAKGEGGEAAPAAAEGTAAAKDAAESNK